MSFPARPLSTAMKFSTGFVAVVPVAMFLTAAAAPQLAVTLLSVAILLVPVFLWAVRQSPLAYEVRGGTLIVRGRLGAEHTYRLTGTVRYPAPTLRLRLFGSSGFFGHTGWFLDVEGRTVRAFVSCAEELVEVGTQQGPIIVSPASPAEFVSAVRAGTVR